MATQKYRKNVLNKINKTNQQVRNKMKYQTKVKKFLKCISSCAGATSPTPTIVMANAKFGLNAAYCEDQDAWYKALALAGHPFSKKNVN